LDRNLNIKNLVNISSPINYRPLSSESDIEVKTPARQNTEKTSQKFRQKSSTPDDECVEVLNEGRKSLMPKRPTKQLKPSDKLPTKTPPVIPAKLLQKPTSVHTDNSVLPDNSAFHKSVSKNKKDKRMKKMKNKKLKKQKIIQPPGESIMIEDSDSGEEAAQSYSQGLKLI
jgi:membrane-associated HD superfamily phosphohydrolase